MKAFRRTASASRHDGAEALRSHDPAGTGWHRWLLIFGASVYGIHLGMETGYLPMLVYGDPTQLTLAVCLLYLIATSYVGLQAWELSRQHDILLDHLAGRPTPAHSWTTDFVAERRGLSSTEITALGDLLHERIKGRTELGWFSAGLHIKLGLLGTVIGFVIMLASIGSANDLQSQGLDTLIRGMGIGMKVSLYTTIVGLVGSMMIGIQMLVVDRAADRLFALIITLPDHDGSHAA